MLVVHVVTAEHAGNSIGSRGASGRARVEVPGASGRLTPATGMGSSSSDGRSSTKATLLLGRLPTSRSSRRVDTVAIISVSVWRASLTPGDSSVEEASLTGTGRFAAARLFLADRLAARLAGGASSSEVTLSSALFEFFAPLPFLGLVLGGMIVTDPALETK